jgi:hypothetical protein
VTEVSKAAGDRLYRACPVFTTKPRVGDMICHQREPTLADWSDEEVRERIRAELSGGHGAHSVARTHCEVIAYVDTPARKVYAIGGNVNQAVSARKLNLRGRGMKIAAAHKGQCSGGHWTLPQPVAHAPRASSVTNKCSLNDRKWFVLLQLR